MSTHAAAPSLGRALPEPAAEAVRQFTGYWWLWLIAGIAWIAISAVLLQFDQASVTTVGVIIGCMFTFAGVQQLMLAAVAESHKWVWILFGVLFLISAAICFVNPKSTFAGIADILGFLFLTVGVWWTIRAFLEKGVSPVWWLGLISGPMMIVLAFWTSGQFFITKAYTLLVFAGIWALMHGISDIVRAFQVRAVGKAL